MKKVLSILIMSLVLFSSCAGVQAKQSARTEPVSNVNYRLVDGTYIIRLDKGQEIMSVLRQFCKENNITSGTIQGIGAGENLNIGFFNTKTKQYEVKNIKDCVEITSLLGNITLKDNEPFIHLHITTADSFHSVSGGHLLSGEIALTGEIFIKPLNTKIKRVFDPEMGISVFNIIN